MVDFGSGLLQGQMLFRSSGCRAEVIRVQVFRVQGARVQGSGPDVKGSGINSEP